MIEREIKVVLSKEANKEFEFLNKFVGREKIKGLNSSFHQTLLRSIQRAVELLKQNPFSGNQIHKRQIPKKYFKKYSAQNLWRFELSNRWRLIYTIVGDRLEVISFVLDIFDHKDYNKVFGYK